LPKKVNSENHFELPIAGRTAIRPNAGEEFFVVIGDQVRRQLTLSADGAFENEGPIDGCKELFGAWATLNADAVWSVVNLTPLLVYDYTLEFFAGDPLAEQLPEPKDIAPGLTLEAEPTLTFDIPTDTGAWENLKVGSQVEVTAHIDCDKTVLPFAGTTIGSQFQVVAIVTNPDKTLQPPVVMSTLDSNELIYTGIWEPGSVGQHVVEIQLRPVGTERPVLHSRQLFFMVQ
jgi:hypothetical protein